MSYRKARNDFEELERISELSDQVELDSMRLELMQNPTQKMAESMYVAGIRFWFSEHGISNSTTSIAFRYSIKGKANP